MMRNLLTIGSVFSVEVTHMAADKHGLIMNVVDDSGTVYELRGPVAETTEAPRKAASGPPKAAQAESGPAPAQAAGSQQEASEGPQDADTGTPIPLPEPTPASRPERRIDPWCSPSEVGDYLISNPDELNNFAQYMSLGKRRLVAKHIVSQVGSDITQTKGYQQLIDPDPEPALGPEKADWGGPMRAASAELGASRLEKRLRMEDRQTVVVDDYLAQKVSLAKPKGDRITTEVAQREFEKSKRALSTSWS